MVTPELLEHIIPNWPYDHIFRRPNGRNDWYFCKICMRAFPIYWVPKHVWKATGFRRKVVCKHCLEEIIPNPEYCTIEEYLVDGHWGGEERKKKLSGIWGLPEEEPPEPRTKAEIEDLLSKGECTICYARTPTKVKKMCKRCAKETCIGPYNLGDWEKL